MNTVTSKDGTSIAFDRTGEGPAIVLVGGAFQCRAFDPRTAHLAELLAPNFTVFHYDRRGRGDSGDTPPYAVEREVEDIDALVKEAGGSVNLFSMSSGAVLALDAAAHGVAITKLALYEPPFVVDDSHEPPFVVDDSREPLPINYLTRLNTLIEAGRPGHAAVLTLTKAAGVPAEYVTPMRDEPFWSGFETVAHTLAYDGAIIADTMSGNPRPGTRWATVTAPTLVIAGGASPSWIHNAAQALADILDDVQRWTLDGQTHDVAPEALAPALTKFFAN
jgi:pimeloyl-ACP methyl ester carboxylesterase